MITDEEYRRLKTRVADLEKKLNLLSVQYSAMLMKQDLQVQKRQIQLSKRKKDKTKYLLNGRLLCKRKLVLECVKEYVANHPNMHFEEVQGIFPDYLQGALGVIRPIELAEVYADAQKRFCFNDEDIIVIDDMKYAVCSQWDIKNIGRFIEVARTLGFGIEEIEIQ